MVHQTLIINKIYKYVIGFLGMQMNIKCKHIHKVLCVPLIFVSVSFVCQRHFQKQIFCRIICSAEINVLKIGGGGGAIKSLK